MRAEVRTTVSDLCSIEIFAEDIIEFLRKKGYAVPDRADVSTTQGSYNYCIASKEEPKLSSSRPITVEWSKIVNTSRELPLNDETVL